MSNQPLTFINFPEHGLINIDNLTAYLPRRASKLTNQFLFQEIFNNLYNISSGNLVLNKHHEIPDSHLRLHRNNHLRFCN